MTEAKGARRLLGLRRAEPIHQQPPGKRGPRIPNNQSKVTQDELDDAPRLSPASPGTPPKKTWEQQYRNFLSHNRHNKQGTIPPLPPVLPPATGSSSAAENKNNKHEGAVRGGKLFAPMFRSGGGTVTPPMRRRVKSMSDELDGTMRNGIEKGSPRATPKSTRIRTTSTPALSQLGGPFLRPRISTEEQPDELATAATTAGATGVPPPFLLTQRSSSSTSQASEAFMKLKLRSDLMRNGTAASSAMPPPTAAVDPLDRSSMKKAFTEFHNSGDSDALSAYLGDDSSQRDARFYQDNCVGVGSTSAVRRSSYHAGMPKVTEGVPVGDEGRTLRPLLGTDKWQSGRRYLIGPAALVACPDMVSHWKQEAVPAFQATDHTSRFGTVLLGRCSLCYGGPEHSSENVMWSSASLVLRQNYLLEFDAEQSATQPRGYAHLQYAAAFPHGTLADVLELQFYGSPCAKSDKRVLLIRMEEASEMNAWMSRLNRAASLTLEDIYDIHPGMLGKGQYSTVHKATRRSDQHNGDNSEAEQVAVKLFDKNQFWRLVVKGVERADTLVRECSVQATLTSRRPNLYSFVHLRGFLETADHIILEMELLDGTDLFKHISGRGVLPEAEAARILYDLVHLIVAMNEVGLSHRDIKPANILMCKRGAHASSSVTGIKLCDFGMATFANADGLVRGRCGTPGKENIHNDLLFLQSC